MQLGHLKLSGYGLLSTQALQNLPQNNSSIFRYLVTICFIIDPGAPAQCRPKGVKHTSRKMDDGFWHLGVGDPRGFLL